MEKIIHRLDFGAEGLWFPLTVSLILALCMLIQPKRLISWVELYITFGVVGLAAWLSDVLVMRVLDWVDLGDAKITGIGEVLSYTLVPTSLAILYLNLTPYEKRWRHSILFTLLSFLIQAGMEYVGYMKVVSPLILYISPIFYLIVFRFILPIHLRIIRKQH
ncbi:hypothetical protein ANABIO32_36140 [Rossellomorea marisflavi]|jgi:hypothetical protein|uniref:hypothetical protein n=1 Tax=Rossellomorea marisflavi TaxID=189381 RepID=UPI0006F953DD|nr:hypothetical protein [Rossellomorea marisflavi]KQU60066.1 hypothetical protein ASG66_10340 [Bacillus sp. Leaf406]MBV6685088.1 hypothetical protein [Bacillus sp. JRC01]MCM2589183.1 hypothetical protein [Rossellomorea marisflavi]UKS63554.1 hypothetical protein K6T23_11780 [Rossellomorea marisflavi]WJV21021.1 hypothetical protein QU593_11495 [Rossellomorea marisflavi]